MNYLPTMRALLLSVALITPTLHGMLEVTTTSEELPVQLRHRGYTPLHLAAYFGDADRIAQLLAAAGTEADALVSAKSINGSTPLHLAAQQGHVAAIAGLISSLQSGKFFNYVKSYSYLAAQDNYGGTLLHYAAANGRIRVLRWSIVNGANIYLTDKQGNLPFHTATQNGHLDAMKILLPCKYRYGKTEYLDFCSRAMTCAVESGKPEVLAFVANMWPEKGSLRVTPLMLAASYGHVPLLQWYLEQEGVLIDEVDLHGKCALHYAARYGHIGVATVLLERNAELAKKRDRSLITPLHEAAAFGHSELIKLLLQYNAEIDAQDSLIRTPLQRAACNGHTRALQLLIVSGASLTITDRWGNTALHEAAACGRKGCVEALIGAESAIDAKNSKQCTPLLCAAGGGHLEVIKCLLRHGADIKQQTHSGNALVYAGTGKHEDVIRYLINNTEVELTSCSDCFPGVVPFIFLAATIGDYKTTSLLIKKGVSLDTKLSDGRTVVSSHNYQRAPQNAAIVRLLMRAGADMLCPDNAGVTPLDEHNLPAAKNYFQNRSLYLSGELGPE